MKVRKVEKAGRATEKRDSSVNLTLFALIYPKDVNEPKNHEARLALS
jgi:hypothetical protein